MRDIRTFREEMSRMALLFRKSQLRHHILDMVKRTSYCNHILRNR